MQRRYFSVALFSFECRIAVDLNSGRKIVKQQIQPIFILSCINKKSIIQPASRKQAREKWAQEFFSRVTNYKVCFQN